MSGSEELTERFCLIFAKIAEGTLDREANRVLPHE